MGTTLLRRKAMARLRMPVAAAVIACFTATAAMGDEALRIESTHPFPETLAMVQTALESRGFRIFATIDHREAAQSVGLDMPPTTVLVYGNPKGGTPLMLAAPDFALELPLRVLVREGEQGRTFVTLNPAVTLEGRHGLPAGLASKLIPAEVVIQAAVTDVAPAR